ncbi:MAG: sulfotransferase domain-containing protein [Geminicoccales bacterium]
MMTDIVRLHPKLLSLSEFFVSLSNRSFTSRMLDGEQFWNVLSVLSPTVSQMFAKGSRVDRLLYKFGPNSRFQPGNVPPILCITLPHLTDDYEALYAELEPVIRMRGPAPIAAQYSFLFDWLCARLGREMAVERSGASLMFVSILGDMFPEARFVHIYRDGRDTALSMQHHDYFRLIARFSRFVRRLGINPYRRPFVYGSNPLYGPIESLTFRVSRLEGWLEKGISLEELGSFWSDMVTAGQTYLRAQPSGRVMNLRYEDVLERPRTELTRFMEFLGPEFADQRWLDQVSKIPQRPPSSWATLEPDKRDRLTAACRPGLILLGYA